MNTLHSKLDDQLNNIRSLILNMGGKAAKSISDAYEILLQKTEHKTLMKDILAREHEINTLQLKVSRACFKILAKQSPVAHDLRLILAILSANTDLERMGDLAVNIAKRAGSINKNPVWEKAVSLFEQIFSQVSKMVHQSLKAFVDEDEKSAHSLLIQDAKVNQIRDNIRFCLEDTAAKCAPPQNPIPQCMDLIIIAGELERIADHTTNIAEEIIFLKTGDDIRHQDVSETE